MPFELHAIAWHISGPKSDVIVRRAEQIEPTIAKMAAAEGYDRDNYTSTSLHTLAWRGPVDTMPLDGNWTEQANKILKEHQDGEQ